jgi:hypothetical protein
MSALTSSEWQGLAATFVLTPTLIIAVEKLIASGIGGDLGMLLGCVLGAAIFGIVPIVAARMMGRPAAVAALRPLRS